jgi:hypothetical protein
MQIAISTRSGTQRSKAELPSWDLHKSMRPIARTSFHSLAILYESCEGFQQLLIPRFRWKKVDQSFINKRDPYPDIVALKTQREIRQFPGTFPEDNMESRFVAQHPILVVRVYLKELRQFVSLRSIHNHRICGHVS